MKTLLVPQVALAVLAFVPTTFGQDPSEHGGMVEFTRPHPTPRARVAQQADEPPRLGVMVSETANGVQISEVFDHSLADRAGLAGGDILFKIGGKRVDAISNIPELLSVFGPGETIGITVIRPGEGLVTLHGKRNAPAPRVEQDHRMPRQGGGFLGVELGEAGPHGVAIDGVIAETAAWFAGLGDGDVLVSVNGADMRSGEDVAKAIGSRRAGEVIEFVYLRGGEQHKSMVRLGHRKRDSFNLQGRNNLEQRRNPMFFRFYPDEDHSYYFGNDEGRAFFGDNEGRVFFGDGDFEWEGFAEDMEDWAGDLEHEWKRKFGGDGPRGLHKLEDHLRKREGLHKHEDHLKELGGLHLEHLRDGHTRQLSIKIEDGVMTIDRDGGREVIELHVDDSFDDIDFLSPDGVRQGANRLHKALHRQDPADIPVLAAPHAAAEHAEIAAECAEAAAECAEAAAGCAEAAAGSCCFKDEEREEGDSIS